jgi:hypothetical protein
MAGVIGVECNADLNGTLGYPTYCTISANNNLILNGTYLINNNGTNSFGGIYFNGDNSSLDCNGSTIYGNSSSDLYGIRGGQFNNVSLKISLQVLQ